jgi:hypothetical protein
VALNRRCFLASLAAFAAFAESKPLKISAVDLAA